MKTLFVTDLDGTLLNNDEKLSEYTVNTINELIEKGMCFSYATGRSLVSATKVLGGLTTNIQVITKNGIFIENAHTKEKIYSLNFSTEEKQIIMEILEKYSSVSLVYGYINGVEKKSWIKGKENEALKHELESWIDDPRYRPVNDFKSLFYGDIFHVNSVGKRDDLEKVYEDLTKIGNFNCLLQKEYYSEHYWCEILPKNATKGNTILKLKEILRCDKIVTFGDGINDIPMFKISDECYAVENAMEELKKHATGIILSNNDNGVARWLKDNFKL